ncbi:MAG: hypothetical protein ACERKN_10100 [Velocimicrobium sp.]
MKQTKIQKKCKKLTAWIALIAMLFTVFSPVGADKVAKAALSPLQYYQKVENANINKQIDSITEGYSSYIKTYQESLKQEAGAEVTLKATLDPSIAEEIGAEDLKSVKASIISMVKGTKTKSTMNFYTNDKQITSLETYADLNGLYYFLIPDLSSSFLKCSMKDLYSSDVTSAKLQEQMVNYFNDPITADTLNITLKRYSALAIDKITDVTMKENETLSVDQLSDEYTKLTVQIDERTALNIADDIFKTAKSDTGLRDIFVDSGLCTKTQYDKAIKESMKDIAKDLKALKESNGSNVFTMSIWVDKKDKIVGRSIVIKDGKEYFKFGYKTVKKGTSMEIDAWAGDKENVIRAKGSFAAKLRGAIGNVKVYIPNSSQKTPDVINIDFKDVKYELNDNKGFINGEINITSELFDGINIKINCNGDSSKQDFICDVLQGAKSLVNITMTTKEIPYQDFNLPTSADKSYDMTTQLDDYILDSDMKGFLQKIKDRSDVKAIDDYMDELLLTYVE